MMKHGLDGWSPKLSSSTWAIVGAAVGENFPVIFCQVHRREWCTEQMEKDSLSWLALTSDFFLHNWDQKHQTLFHLFLAPSISSTNCVKTESHLLCDDSFEPIHNPIIWIKHPINTIIQQSFWSKCHLFRIHRPLAARLADAVCPICALRPMFSDTGGVRVGFVGGGERQSNDGHGMIYHPKLGFSWENWWDDFGWLTPQL